MNYFYVPSVPAPDIFKGAAARVEVLFGTKGPRGQVYCLMDCNGLPHFKMSTMMCAGSSTLEAWIASQEAEGSR